MCRLQALDSLSAVGKDLLGGLLTEDFPAEARLRRGETAPTDVHQRLADGPANDVRRHLRQQAVHLNQKLLLST